MSKNNQENIADLLKDLDTKYGQGKEHDLSIGEIKDVINNEQN
jgi:hypothetical protein